MNVYKKVILSLSLLTLIVPVQNTSAACYGDIHFKGLAYSQCLIIGGAITGLLFNSILDPSFDDDHVKGWHPGRENFALTTLNWSLLGATLLGSLKLLLCFNNDEACCDTNITFSNACPYLWAGAAAGFLKGVRQWYQYNTPEHSLKQAQLLSKIPSSHQDILDITLLLERDGQEFWNKIGIAYCTQRYSFVSAKSDYENLIIRLSRVMLYLDKAIENNASGELLVSIQDLKINTVSRMKIIQKAIDAIKNHPIYSKQIQALLENSLESTKRMLAAEQQLNSYLMSLYYLK